MIKILTSHSAFGGSTLALIELCALFNENNYPCELYGRHRWHLSRCPQGKMLDEFHVERDDHLILHRCDLPEPLPCRRAILTCHETTDFPLAEHQTDGYDVVHFVSEKQRMWHSFDGQSVVIPNLVQGVRPITDTVESAVNVAGIVGTVCEHKQTHISIERALADGVNCVLIYGAKYEPYFSDFVQPWLSDRVVFMGLENDRQKIYESIDRVYLSSKSETFGRVEAECRLAGIRFYGTADCTGACAIWSSQDILDKWIKLLDIHS